MFAGLLAFGSPFERRVTLNVSHLSPLPLPSPPSPPIHNQVRGLGLLVGVQLDFMAGPIVEAARAAGVLVITAGKGDVVRLVPPLTISEAEIDKACEVLGRVINEVSAQQ